MFSTEVYFRNPFRKFCFRPPAIDIPKAEEIHLHQKKSVIDGVKGFGKIKVDDINCVTLAHHVRHRFLEDQQIGETGPME